MIFRAYAYAFGQHLAVLLREAFEDCGRQVEVDVWKGCLLMHVPAGSA